MTPTEYYQRLIESDQILPDDQQSIVINQLQIIYDQLTNHNQKTSFLQKLQGKNQPSIKGLYLWGDVGVGKTFLIDCFFYTLPFKNKLRIHFHQFMKMIHEQLTSLQGETKPLEKIAAKLAKEYHVICFDELLVHDITDAMLLAGFFKALYKEKICLLFTSNTPPDNLYLKGIQRDSFLPAIDAIKNHSQIIHITTDRDYRFREYEANTVYFTPLDEKTAEKITELFDSLNHHQSCQQTPLRIYDREIAVKKASDDIVWFDFFVICGVPRNQNDYIAIANKFQTIIVSDVKAIQPEQNDLARAFINLVDVFYDANRRLIISAEVPIEKIYQSGRMLFEFARTKSRLIEMQTPAWQKKCASLIT